MGFSSPNPDFPALLASDPLLRCLTPPDTNTPAATGDRYTG